MIPIGHFQPEILKDSIIISALFLLVLQAMCDWVTWQHSPFQDIFHDSLKFENEYIKYLQYSIVSETNYSIPIT